MVLSMVCSQIWPTFSNIFIHISSCFHDWIWKEVSLLLIIINLLCWRLAPWMDVDDTGENTSTLVLLLEQEIATIANNRTTTKEIIIVRKENEFRSKLNADLIIIINNIIISKDFSHPSSHLT